MEKKVPVLLNGNGKDALLKLMREIERFCVTKGEEFEGMFATKADLSHVIDSVDQIGGIIDVSIDGTELVVTYAGGTELRLTINASYANKAKSAAMADSLTLSQNIELTGPVVGTGLFTGDATCNIETTIDPNAFADFFNSLTDGQIQQIIEALFQGGLSIETEEVTDPTTGETKTVVTIVVNGNLDVKGDAEVEGDLVVDGNETVKGDETVGGDMEVDGDLLVKGNEEVQKDLTVDGDTNIKGGLTVSGTISGTTSNATKLGTATVGASATPIYLNAGSPVACGYSFTSYLQLSGGTLTGALTCNSTISASSYTATSDRNEKTIVGGVNANFSAIKAYRFVWKDQEKYDDQTHIGLIAQEVAEILPEAVCVNDEGVFRLDYNAVTAALVNKVNELTARIEKIESEEKEDGDGSEQ